MRFIDSTLKDNLTRDRLKMGASIAAIVALSLLVFMGVYTLLDSKARADRARRNAQADVLMEAVESSEQAAPSDETVTESDASETTETSATELAPVIVSESEESAVPGETSADASSSEATETSTETAPAPTDPDAVEEFYTSVYAGSDINLRSGPGTDYDIVRLIHMGEGIDVTGRTASGWYRTYSGNYVLISLTSEEPTTPANTESNTAGSASTDGMTYYGTCHITFYGPQPLSDGSWSTTTATGTSCSEGRTVAADWDIFPAGTTIYIPNDPLGGDGYYTVEDMGPGVSGNPIDIFANGSHTVTDCEVYIVN